MDRSFWPNFLTTFAATRSSGRLIWSGWARANWNSTASWPNTTRAATHTPSDRWPGYFFVMKMTSRSESWVDNYCDVVVNKPGNAPRCSFSPRRRSDILKTLWYLRSCNYLVFWPPVHFLLANLSVSAADSDPLCWGTKPDSASRSAIYTRLFRHFRFYILEGKLCIFSILYPIV